MSLKILNNIFFQRTIPVLKIKGTVDSQLVLQLKKQLDSFNSNSIQVLALVINSPGGCPYQIDLLSKCLKKYSTEHQIPLYTFATEQALSGAYRLLALGDKVYAQSTSKIGLTSFNINRLKWREFLNNYGINILITSNNHNSYSAINRNQEMNSEQQNIQIDKYLNQSTAELTQQCSQLRNILTNDIDKNIYIGDQAKQMGLVDDISSYESQLMKEFPKAKIIPTTSQSEFQKMLNYFNLFIKITQSRGFLGLMLLLFIKGTIKWILILIVWRKSRQSQKAKKLEEQNNQKIEVEQQLLQQSQQQQQQ